MITIKPAATFNKKISRAVTDLEDGSHFDVVVIGSGYGGGIAASRMARAKDSTGNNLSVCVLERGREIPPGAYPNTLEQLSDETHVETKIDRLGNPTALLDLRVGDDVSVLVGCGLGGTSLINAGVALEADKRVFEKEPWPVVFRQNPSELDKYYERAHRWLGTTKYPAPECDKSSNYPSLQKAESLRSAGGTLKKKFDYLPITISFKDGCNHVGVKQAACVLCGDCVTGCNYGAKNTTLMNYLPDAYNHGAQIFTCANVTYIARSDTRWSLHIESLEDDPGSKTLTVIADIVILGAGTLGSTELLLRSRKKSGLSFSERLGKSFSCNGNFFGFSYNSNWKEDGDHRAKPQDMFAGVLENSINDVDQRRPIYGVGAGDRELQSYQKPGPNTVSFIDLRDVKKVERGLVIEEGTIPGALATLMSPFFFFSDATEGNVFKYGDTKLRLEDAQRLGNSMLNDPAELQNQLYSGPLSRTQTYLIMGHDSASGKIVLDDGEGGDSCARALVRWPGAGRENVYKRDGEILSGVSEAIRGQCILNPLWNEALDKRVITAHPLGGCGMADSGDKGVVNDKCQVFCDSSNSGQVYKNLYVVDGAVIPLALGVNPFLTISAIAERACEKLAIDRGWNVEIDGVMNEPLQERSQQELTTAVAVGVVKEEFAKDDETLRVLNTIAESFAKRIKTIKVSESISGGPGDKLKEDLDPIFLGAINERIDKFWTDIIKIYFGDSRAEQDLEVLLKELVEEFPSIFSPIWFSFTEQMTGFFSKHLLPHDLADTDCIANPFEVASKYGEADGENGKMVAELTITAGNLYALINDASHDAHITGTVTCKALSGSETKMKVKNGKFHLLMADPDKVETWKMVYSMELEGNKNDYRFEGNKIVHQRTGSNWWTDVTTLFVTVYEGDAEGVVGRGILRLGIDDLIHQASKIKMERAEILDTIAEWLRREHYWDKAKSYFEKLDELVRLNFMRKFAGLFGTVIFQAYGGLLSDLSDFPAQENKTRKIRSLTAPTPEIHTIMTKDHVQLLLTRYKGGNAGPVILAPGFGVRASSFATDTVSENIVEYLTKNKFDVWLFDYRASPTLTDGMRPFTIDHIAIYDWPAAIHSICEITGAQSIQAIAHCVGSMTLLMALLRVKKIRGKVRSAICSQLTLHPVTGWENHLKSDVDLVDILEKTFGFTEIDLRSSSSTTSKAIDAWLWSVAAPKGQECRNPVCHRVFSLYGPSYAHEQLNKATHVGLCEMFGKVHTKAFEQLSLIIKKGEVVDRKGRNRYLTGQNADNLTLPLAFVAGEQNQLFFPETSAITFAWLSAHNPGGHYERQVFPGYAHMDFFIGKSAAETIFPYFLTTLQNPPGEASR